MFLTCKCRNAKCKYLAGMPEDQGYCGDCARRFVKDHSENLGETAMETQQWWSDEGLLEESRDESHGL